MEHVLHLYLCVSLGFLICEWCVFHVMDWQPDRTEQWLTEEGKAQTVLYDDSETALQVYTQEDVHVKELTVLGTGCDYSLRISGQ